MELLSFFIVSAILLAAALGVVLFYNPIYSALSLMVSLMAVAVLFGVLEAHFIAASQIIVYAGAIVVLVLFVLMLLNYKVEKFTITDQLVLGVCCILGVVFLMAVVPIVAGGIGEQLPAALSISAKKSTVSAPLTIGSVRSVGERLFTKHVVLFEVASVLIMAALIGSVMLAKRRYR